MWLPRRVEIFFEKIESSLSAIQKAVQNQDAAANRAYAETKRKLREVPWAAITSIILNTKDEREAAKTEHRKDYTQQGKLVLWTKLSVLLSILILIVYIGTLWELKQSTDAATKSANTAACALRENQRQFSATSAKNQAQFDQTVGEMQAQTTVQLLSAIASRDAVSESKRASDKSLKESERILSVQARPWLGIVIQSITDERQPDQWLGMSQHVVKIKYVIHNYGGAPAVQQLSNFTGTVLELVEPVYIASPESCPTLPTSQSAGKYQLSSSEPVFPGADTTAQSSQTMALDPRQRGMRIVGCVAYRGPLDNRDDPKAVHITEIETAVFGFEPGKEIPKDSYSFSVVAAN